MGGESTLLTLNDARHLLRRTEFGATPRALATLLKRASTRGEAADYLLDFRPSRFRPRARSIDLAHNKWVKYMIRSKLQLQEKLVLFWHDHFATNYATVGRVTLMANQNRLLRTYCKGNFKDFVKAINLDAAMMEFLDTNDNRKQQPNENYGRELQELFTLGVNDFAGNPNYEQEDVAQIARAFTGWRYDDKGVAYFSDNRHDYMIDWPERGAKRIYKTRGGFNDATGQDFAADGEGEAEIGRVIDIIFEHRDTDGKKTVARYIARRLVTYFAHPDPDTAFVDEVVAASGFDTQWEIAPLLRAIFVHDSFYETAAPAPFDATTKKSVKFPVDYAVAHAAAAQHEAEEQVPVRRRRQLRRHPLAAQQHGPAALRPAQRLRLGLGDGLAQQLDDAGALRLRARRDVGARPRRERLPPGGGSST